MPTSYVSSTSPFSKSCMLLSQYLKHVWAWIWLYWNLEQMCLDVTFIMKKNRSQHQSIFSSGREENLHVLNSYYVLDIFHVFFHLRPAATLWAAINNPILQMKKLMLSLYNLPQSHKIFYAFELNLEPFHFKLLCSFYFNYNLFKFSSSLILETPSPIL